MMKFRILLMCLASSPALADIYKFVDTDGHVTYSSAPIKGAKRIVLTSQSRTPAEHTRVSSTPDGFPKVNEATQKDRDGSRRKILEDELKAEQDLLDTARQLTAPPPKDPNKLNELTKQVDLHQGNIAAIKTELSKLK